MYKKLILAVLFIGAIAAGIMYVEKQPVKTMNIGTYAAVPDIAASLDSFNIKFASSADDKIHIQLKGHKLKKDRITIEENKHAFVIKEKQQKKKWNEYIVFHPAPTIIVQVPKSVSKTLTLQIEDGDAAVQGLALDMLRSDISTGAAKLKNMSVANAAFNTLDGNVTIAESVLDRLAIKTGTGDISVKNSSGTTHTIQTEDGQIKIADAVEQPKVNLKSSSGDIAVAYKEAPTSLQLTTDGVDTNIDLPNYNKTAHSVGKGTNHLSANTKDGSIVIK